MSGRSKPSPDWLVAAAEIDTLTSAARRDIAVDLVITQTELAKDIAVMFALEGGLAERLEFFAREMPRATRKPVGSAIAVRDFLDGAPILRPLHLGEPLQ